MIAKLRTAALLALAFVMASYPVATLSAATARVYELLLLPLTQHVPQFGRVNGALTLTGLIPTIYQAMDIVARELVGFIPAVSKDSQMTRAAVNQTVRSPIVGAMTAEDLTPANVAADTPAQTISYIDMSITKARSVPFGVTGEEYMSLTRTEGNTYETINRDRIAQALRTLTNEVEADLAALHLHASRAYGTAGTTPFATANDLTDFAQARKILDDNGSPQSDFHMVIDTAAAANLRGKMSHLFKANEANSIELLRRGNISAEQIQGFNMHNSAAVKQAVTVGTGASATTNAAGYAIGATTITLASAGTGSIIAGDVVTFAGDTNKYVVLTGDADVSGGGTIVLQEPGLRKAIAASTTAITVVSAAARNMFFHRSAIQLATRAPAMPPGGDAADDVMVVTDPVSGISFEFCVYRQKRQVRYEVNLAWGVAAANKRYLGLLLG
jgi:hypothetical protein